MYNNSSRWAFQPQLSSLEALDLVDARGDVSVACGLYRQCFVGINCDQIREIKKVFADFGERVPVLSDGNRVPE